MKISLIGYLSEDEVLQSQGSVKRIGGPILHMITALEAAAVELFVVTNRGLVTTTKVSVDKMIDIDPYRVKFQDCELSSVDPIVVTPENYRKINTADLSATVMSADAVIISSIFTDIESEAIYKLQSNVKMLAIDVQGFQRYNSCDGKLKRSQASIELFSKANVIKFNESEANLQFGEDESKLRSLSLADSRIVLVTKGSRGCDLWCAGEKISTKPPTSKCKSSIGAGDMLLAGFVYRLISGEPIREALESSQDHVVEQLEAQNRNILT